MMLHRMKREISGAVCFSLLVTLLLSLGPIGSVQASLTGDPVIVKAQDALLQGYGVEKRGSVPEGSDTLYAGEGYISFFFGEDPSQIEQVGTATFHLNVPAAGLYKLSLGYYIPVGYGAKVAGLQVNGAGAGEAALDAPPEGTVVNEKMVSKVMLNAGDNTVTITRGWGYYGIEYVKVESADTPAPSSKLEAEDGMMTGSVAIGTTASGYSGEGYAFLQSDGSLTLTYDAAAAGLYEIAIAYSAPFGDKKTHLVVNGQTSEISFAQTSEFVETSGGKAMLQAGANTIQFNPNWGWYYIDYIKLSAAAAPAGHDVESKLVNPNASPEARALMNYLVDRYGRNIIAGQQDLADVEWIAEQTGKYPAIFSSDLMDYSPSRVEYGATSTEVEKMIEWFNRGGMIALSWHWNAPKGLYNEPGKEWWRGFYTEFTTFDVQYALDNPESEDYQLLIRDIDAIAVQLKRLQDAGVPVLWRPLHEAEGGWFWWGAKGPDPTKQLWRLMYDRMTNHHELNNLIWVWNSEKTEWYPGDDVVDISSVDIYNPAGDYNPSIAKYDTLVSLVDNKKLVALAENGPIPDPDQLEAYGARWSFFSTWTGNFIRDGLTNSLEHLQKVYNSEYVITLDELPQDLYSAYKIEAEKGTLTGLTIGMDAAGYSGDGYVTGFDEAGDNVSLQADVAGGRYAIAIRYKTLGGDKTNTISLNGGAAIDYTFTDAADWTDAVIGEYELQNGANTIAISNNWGWMDIDYVKLTRIEDTTPPTLTVTASKSKLTPPNHKMVTINLDWNAQDLESGVASVKLVSVTSNEPDNGEGDGNTANDIQGADIGTTDKTIQLRAERSGSGTGRIYTITYEAVDAAGNSTLASTTVIVPR
jgi:hypothetical protein